MPYFKEGQDESRHLYADGHTGLVMVAALHNRAQG